MNGLQKAIEKGLSNLPVLGLATLLKRKLSEQGVKISSRKAEIVARQSLAGKSSFSLPGNRTEPLRVTLTKEDSEEVVKRIELFMERDLEQLLLKMQDDLAPRTLKTLKRRWPAEYRRQKTEISEFRSRLYGRWKTGISRLHMLVTLARELGDNINRDARQNPGSSGAALVDVLTRLHARSCQVAGEVIVLLETGFANGAMARWRTMHEIAVTAAFISEHGNACAERYTDHQIVESYKGAEEYETVHARLGYDPIPAKVMNEIRKQYDNVIKKYGKAFSTQCGWAAKDLSGRQSTFKEIEKAAKIDYLRGHYRMASHVVHANSKGIFFSMTSMFPSELLLAGASNSGLADAGDGAAHSLLMVSAILLTLAPTFDHQVAVRTMGLLRAEIGKAFLRANQKLYRDEEQVRAAEADADKVLRELGIDEKLTSELLREASTQI
jgi:hypothetical protein